MDEEQKELLESAATQIFQEVKKQSESMGCGIGQLFGFIAYGMAKDFQSFDSSFPKDEKIHSLLVVINEEECSARVHAVLK